MQSSYINSPEVLYQNKETLLEMANIIDNLPIKYKEVIHMKYMLGLSYEEISKKLMISISKVESRLYIARKRLQKEKGKLKGKE
ncbi:RNA polymerase sigma factor [Clostridium sp. FP2]|uniref:RNA polymerase sigma factor n=1 Tax=Clostridium sp. FP2 TaxID=2724481 RepID=UPI0013E99732|nr:RNA polymerase sigma factor [Clostridium sp. FP2]